jgi:phosphinothricin acetyltransferase
MTTSFDLVVEPASKADLPAILALSNWAAEHTTANFATEPETLASWTASWDATSAMYPWLVARRGGAVVGFARATPHRSRGAYAWTAEVSVYVDPSQHRRGVGRALYDRLIPALRDQGYVTLLAGIVGGHQASERLHAEVGFRATARLQRVGWKLGAWHDVVYWQLDLDPSGCPPGVIRPVASLVGLACLTIALLAGCGGDDDVEEEQSCEFTLLTGGAAADGALAIGFGDGGDFEAAGSSNTLPLIMGSQGGWMVTPVARLDGSKIDGTDCPRLTLSMTVEGFSLPTIYDLRTAFHEDDGNWYCDPVPLFLAFEVAEVEGHAAALTASITNGDDADEVAFDDMTLASGL